MRSLYEVLGVDRSVTGSAIRRAYRSRAKAAHPDCGGSVEAFRGLALALEVLSDPVRRARYDETGEYEAGVVDNREAELWNLIAAALDQVAAECVGRGQSLEGVDLVDLVKGAFELRNRQHQGQKGQLAVEVARWERLAGRFERIGEGENRLAAVARGKVEAMRLLMARCDTEMGKGAAALAALKDYRFRVERSMGVGQGFPRGMAALAHGGRMW